MSRRKSSSKSNNPSGSSRRDSRKEKGRSGELDGEDARLWSLVAKSLEPLKPCKSGARMRVGPMGVEDGPQPPSGASADSMNASWRKVVGDPPNAHKSPEAAGGASSRNQPSPKSRPSPKNQPSPKSRPSLNRRGAANSNASAGGPELAGFSRREMRQISSGRRAIEARLDLHGMRQAEAHVALKGFLARCCAAGMQHVLVITGKGRINNNYQDDGDLLDLFERREPGVLRRLTPLWLAEPGLRSMVIGYTEAPRNHGGDGALYIRLRRKR